MYPLKLTFAASFAIPVLCRPAPQGPLPVNAPLGSSALLQGSIATTTTSISTSIASTVQITSVIASSASTSIATSATSAPSSAASGKAGQSAAATSLATASPQAKANTGGATAGSTAYTKFTGDGSTEAGWPSDDKWISFDDAWTANLGILQSSCTQFSQNNDISSEIDDIKTAVTSTAASTGVDIRWIFATIMNESSGCVRVPTTPNTVPNSGLMQSFGGTSCFGINPCPTDKINQMVQDGSGGVNGNAGLEQTFSQAPASATAQKTYQASVIYNGGSTSFTPTDLSKTGGRPCYASDMANRLIGFVGTSACTL